MASWPTTKIALYTLLALFPLAGNSVRSWTSIFFWLIVLLAMITRPWRKIKLEKIERHILWIIGGLFSAIVVSSAVNDWGDLQTKGLGVQIRYLALIPLYFLCKEYPGGLKVLTLGCIAGAVMLTAQGVLDIAFIGLERSYGIYESPGLVATQAAVFALILGFSTAKPEISGVKRSLSFLGLLFAITALLLSGSRATIIPATLVMILIAFFYLPHKLRIWGTVALLVLTSALYISAPPIQTQIQRTLYEFSFFYEEKPFAAREDLSSMGTRIQMWKAATILFLEKPVFGIGWRNFGRDTERLVSNSIVSPRVLGSPHPHNTYLEFLAGYGLIGFSLLIAFFIFALKATRNNEVDKLSSHLLLRWFLIFYLINAINEGGLFIYGNSLSFFLVFFGVLLANVMQQKGKQI
jgi:O-antigen ligase